MRVTQRTMFNSYIDNMNSTLSAYMESNIQGSSQKKINRPSDDPAGMALVLNTRNDISRSTQFEKNADTAQGWVDLGQSTLGSSVSLTISKIKELAVQASTGTYLAENREQIATQLREYFGTLVSLSNTKFGDKSLFSGHKYDVNAFDETLAVTSSDPALKDAPKDSAATVFSNIPPVDLPIGATTSATGLFNPGTRVRFDEEVNLNSNGTNFLYSYSEDDGKTWIQSTAITNGSNAIDLAVPSGHVNVTTVPATLPAPPTTVSKDTEIRVPSNRFSIHGKSENSILVEFTTVGDFTAGTADIEYRWTDDGGDNWKTGTYTPTAAPNNKINLDGIEVTMPATGTVGAYDPATGDGAFIIRPSAVYNGDTNDRPPSTINIGGPAGMTSSATGTFQNDTLVRFDETVDLGTIGTEVKYSYSEDNGATWIKATTTTSSEDTIRLTVPSGYTDVYVDPASSTVGEKTQVIIHPNRAELGYEIMEDTYISVNGVGKDIFGGMYGDPPMPVDDVKGNLFETVGELIGYCETNNQAGVESTLEKLTTAHEVILTETARLGGIDNRITLAEDVLSLQKLSKVERLSYTEDIDLTVLLTTMAQQQLAYNTVLQSSSMIMQMSLTKFL